MGTLYYLLKFYINLKLLLKKYLKHTHTHKNQTNKRGQTKYFRETFSFSSQEEKKRPYSVEVIHSFILLIHLFTV